MILWSERGWALDNHTGVRFLMPTVALYTPRVSATLALAACLLAGCQRDTAVEPASTPVIARTLVIARGADQTAAAGTMLPVVPLVRLLDSLGRPVHGQLVRFAVREGSLDSASSTSSADGIVSPGRWTLGPSLGAQGLTVDAGPSGLLIIVATAPTPVPTFPPLVYAPRQYDVVDITQDVGEGAGVVRMNARSQVAVITGGPGAHPVLWEHGTITSLAPCVSAVDMNDLGQVLCNLSTGYGVWDRGTLTRLTALDSLPPHTTLAWAQAISNAGIVTGDLADSPECAEIPCMFKLEHGRISVVGANLFVPPMYAGRINAKGDMLVRGFASSYSTPSYVLNIATSQFHEYDVGQGGLGTLSDSGWIAGTTRSHPGDPIAALFRPDAPTLHFGIGHATGVNNHGVVVGTFERTQSWLPGTYGYTLYDPALLGPFLWDGSVKLLSQSTIDDAWVITSAIAINDAGDILALADNRTLGRIQHYVLLRPTS